MERTLRTKLLQLHALLTSNRLLVGLAGAFLISAGVTSYLTFLTVRSFVASWNLGELQGLALANAGQAASRGGDFDLNAPLQSASGPTAEAWDGTSRVTVLLMGLDYRDWEIDQGPPRTDTMILFTLDPVSRTAGVLSIPRDLWVNIPGFEANKLNTAYRLGEVYKLPGGGSGLAIETVEQLIGVPIQYYALVDFYAFERFIDELGGIEVDVPEEIRVDPLGPGNTVVLPAGPNLLVGQVALAYARNRDTAGGDFDRADRQQQVILAIRDRILSLDMLTTLISKAPVLYHDIAAGIQTNLSLDETIKLALLAQQIQAGAIQRGVIGADQVTFGTSFEGLDILVPIPDEIRLLRDEIFATDTVGGPVAVATDPQDLVEAEGARVSVLNGTFTPGLAAETTEYLKTLGVNVTVTGNASQSYNFTTVIDYTGKPYTVQYLVDALEISPERIFNRFDMNAQVDVEVNLGNDWSLDSP